MWTIHIQIFLLGRSNQKGATHFVLEYRVPVLSGCVNKFRASKTIKNAGMGRLYQLKHKYLWHCLSLAHFTH